MKLYRMIPGTVHYQEISFKEIAEELSPVERNELAMAIFMQIDNELYDLQKTEAKK